MVHNVQNPEPVGYEKNLSYGLFWFSELSLAYSENMYYKTSIRDGLVMNNIQYLYYACGTSIYRAHTDRP